MVISGESTSAADFELVTRLEKLILANQANITSTLPVDNAFSDLAADFRDRLADVPSRRHQRDDDDDDVPDSSRSNEGHNDDDVDVSDSSRSNEGHNDDDLDVPDSSRSNEGHSARSRSRSLSPMRTRDPNIY